MKIISQTKPLTSSFVNEYKEKGYLIIHDLLSEEDIKLCQKACKELEEIAKDFQYSKGDFVLEAPQGGFYAQNELVQGFRGILRTVLNVELHSEFFRLLPSIKNFEKTTISVLFNRTQFELLSSILWWKAAKVGSAQPWHQDFAYASTSCLEKYSAGMTIWIAIDEATQKNGCLQFVPRSHTKGLLPYYGSPDPKDNNQLYIDINDLFPHIKPEIIELKPGSAVIFDAYTVHGSEKNNTSKSRKAITYGYVLPKKKHIDIKKNTLEWYPGYQERINKYSNT